MTLWKEIPLPQLNVASYKCPGIRLSFEYTTYNIAFSGRGRGRNRYSYDVQNNVPQVYNFLNVFVQDCSNQPFLNLEPACI